MPDTDPNPDPTDETASHLQETDDGDPPDDSSDVTRRAVLGGTAALLGTGGWLAYAVERAKAAAVGVIGDPDPYTRAHVNTIRFVPQASDPSSPDDGTVWYNPNA